MKVIKLYFACLIIVFVTNAALAQKPKTEPVDLVYPLVDAANSRWFFFNSASRPFGMVNLSPDNAIDADWNAGYRYEKDSIKCFSHIHCWALSFFRLEAIRIFSWHNHVDHDFICFSIIRQESWRQFLYSYSYFCRS